MAEKFLSVLIQIMIIYGLIFLMGCRTLTKGAYKVMKVNVVIIPIGNVDSKDVIYLENGLQARFGNCTITQSIKMPAEAYNSSRGQYSSEFLLQYLPKFSQEIPNEAKVLGVTVEDLYVPDLNFVFGQAQLNGRYAIVSLKRLNPVFYGVAADRELYLHRMLKESVHELGHTLGLNHCPNKRCVMHFSNSLWDTDIKSDWFCGQCSAKINKR